MKHHYLPKVFLCLLFNTLFHFGFSQNIAINATGTAPDASAILDIQSGTQGLLIPQVSLVALNGASPLSSPAHSIMIYNTNASISGGVGYYYNAGNSATPNWVKLVASDTSTYKIDDLRVVIDKGTNSAQLGSLTGITGPEIWFFRDNQGVEAMSFTLQLPHTWKEGSRIYPHIHWVPKSSGSGNVQWNLDYTWATLDETTPQTFPAITTTSVVVNGPFTMNKHLLTPLTTGNVGIDGTGKSVSSILVCRIWRNADSENSSDTYAGDAGGLSVDFHYQYVNTFR